MDWAIKESAIRNAVPAPWSGLPPGVYRYGSTRPNDTAIRDRLRELASERRRFGYRRLHILLKREGRDELEEALSPLQLLGRVVQWPSAR